MFEVEISDNPDYIFFGPFSNKHLEFENSIKIYWGGEDLSPDFNLCDYAVGYDHIIFGDRYLRFPGLYKNNYDDIYNDNNIIKLANEKHLNVSKEKAKRRFCSFVYSHGNGNPIRDELFSELSEYKKVDSGGKYRNNLLDETDGVKDKLKFESKHKFSIACENSSHRGYSTEKIIDAFAACTVPIYWGDPDVEMIYNKKSFVNCNGLSVDEVVKRVKEIDNDDEMYLAMLSEPAFISDEYSQENMIRVLREFLYHIFGQNKEDAYRRNREYWGKKYYDMAQKKERIYMKHAKLHQLVWKIVKFWRK